MQKLKFLSLCADYMYTDTKIIERNVCTAMGMAASQGRLLFMTARLSNNEFEQQSVAYSKQRLAEASQLANDKYLEALNATSYQVLVGYNGTDANYENVTYSQLTGYNNIAIGKQYIVQDTNGKILVTSDIAEKFEKSNGDYNKFLAELGLTQSDIDVSDKQAALKAIHEAWDKYLVSVGQGINAAPTNTGNDIENDPPGDSRHILGFGFNTEGIGGEEPGILDGYPVYHTAHATGTGAYAGMEFDVLNYGTENGIPSYQISVVQNSSGDFVPVYTDNNNEQHVIEGYEFELDDTTDPPTIVSYTDSAGNRTDVTGPIYVHPYKSASSGTVFIPMIIEDEYISETELEADGFNIPEEAKPIPYEGTTAAQRALYDYAVAITEAFYNNFDGRPALENDKNKIAYYRNIYNMMITKGYTTYDQMKKDNYISSTEEDEKKAYIDDEWLVRFLKNGKLHISYFSAVEREFIGTSLDDDESITEKEDKSKIAIAEQVYNSTMDRIEKEDKYFDMQLNKLEAEHSALQTEYESVAKVIQKNVEKSFGTFNA